MEHGFLGSRPYKEGQFWKLPPVSPKVEEAAPLRPGKSGGFLFVNKSKQLAMRWLGKKGGDRLMPARRERSFNNNKGGGTGGGRVWKAEKGGKPLKKGKSLPARKNTKDCS